MKRKILALAGVAALILVAWLLLREYVSVEMLAQREDELRTFLDRRPLTGFAIGLASYIAVSLVPGTTGKSLVYGWLFGMWQGVLMVNVGLTVAAIATFLLARYLFRDLLQEKFGSRLKRIDHAVEEDGAFYLFALRMMHAPYSVTNYVMGATSLRLLSFWWATQLGMLPGNVVFVYAGTQLPTIEQAAEEGVSGVFSAELVIAFVAMGLFPLGARWVIRRFWKKEPSVEDGE